MPIPEEQLQTWSAQGSKTQSSSTYNTVKNVLEGRDAAYAAKSFEVFLQGSYGNDTNIYADSDVDVVIRIDSVYHEDTSAISAPELQRYKETWSVAAYQLADFRRDVLAQLTKNFGQSVKQGNKAIFVKGDNARRDADVLPAAQYRKYFRYTDGGSSDYVEGICFWTADNVQIINYPKQHAANCTRKHQATHGVYKRAVRVLKNMRNRMIDDGYLADGVAPSYFLEGMLYNVPNSHFAPSLQDTVANAINWVIASDRTQLQCANEQYYLLHPTSPVTWRAEKLEVYLDAVRRYWDAW